MKKILPLLDMTRRVSGAAPWTPTELGAKLIGWYEADTSANFTLTGNLIDQWDDLTGNGNHLTSSGSNRPDFDSVNKAVVFDAVNSERLTNLAYQTFAAGANPKTYVMVGESDEPSPTGNTRAMTIASNYPTGGAGFNVGLSYLLNPNHMASVRFGNGTIECSTAGTDVLNKNIFGFTSQGWHSRSLLRFNGDPCPTEMSSGFALQTNYTGTYAMSVGCNILSGGSLGQFTTQKTHAIFIIDGVLSKSEWESLEGYVTSTSKYNFKSVLPVAHPYKSSDPLAGQTIVDWTPADDIDRFTCWLDPNDASTITESGGDVSEIRDKTTNNFDFELPFVIMRPRFVP